MAIDTQCKILIIGAGMGLNSDVTKALLQYGEIFHIPDRTATVTEMYDVDVTIRPGEYLIKIPADESRYANMKRYAKPDNRPYYRRYERQRRG